MLERAIEPLNVSVLVELTKLDVSGLDLVPFTPLDKDRGRHFGAIINSNTTLLRQLWKSLPVPQIPQRRRLRLPATA